MATRVKKPIRPRRKKRIVWIISDGISGHFNYSKGVASALHQAVDIQVLWVDMRLRGGWMRIILAWLLNMTQAKVPLSYLRWFYQFSEMPLSKPDIIIGTGGKISFAVVWLAKMLSAQSIFCGSIRRLHIKLFNAVITVEPEYDRHYIVLEVYPTPILEIEDRTQQACWALLIGGDREGIHYEQGDWNILANAINTLSQTLGIRWLITTSRRTGLEAEQTLSALIAPEYIEMAVWWSESEQPVVPDYLAQASVVVTTADSHSMISEALSARKPSVVIYPRQFDPDTIYMTMLRRYVNRQRIALIPIDGLHQVSSALPQIQPFEEDVRHQLLEQLVVHPYFNLYPSADVLPEKSTKDQ